MTCIGPIPEHLAEYGWYAPHQAWLRDRGLPHHNPGDAEPQLADLFDTDLFGADLHGANLMNAYLMNAYLRAANLSDANLRGAVLTSAVLSYADLSDANLSGANLRGAVLTRANLTNADLSDTNLMGAYLRGAVLASANLTGAVLTDGRTLKEWQADPLAGLCTDPEAVSRASAAWGRHTWRDCPLHEGMGVNSLYDIDDHAKRCLAACFIALFDGCHLPKPSTD